jgi:hypothetical protein
MELPTVFFHSDTKENGFLNGFWINERLGAMRTEHRNRRVVRRCVRVAIPFCAALWLGACTITEPVVVIGQNGQILRGTVTAALTGGSFSASDGKLTCAGTYNSWDVSTTISMPVTCSDGRRGIVIATRDDSGLAGSGTIRLTDGSTATFIFGAGAAAF